MSDDPALCFFSPKFGLCIHGHRSVIFTVAMPDGGQTRPICLPCLGSWAAACFPAVNEEDADHG